MVKDSICLGNEFEFYITRSIQQQFDGVLFINDQEWINGNNYLQEPDTFGLVNATDIYNNTGYTPGKPFKIFSYVINNISGCADTSSLEITYAAVPTCNAGGNVDTLWLGDSAMLGGSPTGDCPDCIGNLLYSWTPNYKLSNYKSANPYTKTDNIATYSVDVTDSVTGCVCSSSMNVLNALPVNWLYFRAKWQEKYAKLNWATAAELNNMGFSIQRSFDGINFSEIAFIKPQKIFSYELSTYQYFDQEAIIKLYPVVFYKIIQIDINQSKNETEIAVLENNLTQIKLLSIAPNPARDFININIYTLKEKTELTLLGSDGKLISKYSLHTPTKGQNFIQINDLANLAKGVYFIGYIDEQGIAKKEKFVIE